MEKTMERLLYQIISKTQDKRAGKVIRIRSTSEFLAVARRSPARLRPGGVKNAEELYYIDIFNELFREAKYFYHQFLVSKRAGDDEASSCNGKRLDVILEAVRESHAVFKPFILERQKSGDHKDVATADLMLKTHVLRNR